MSTGADTKGERAASEAMLHVLRHVRDTYARQYPVSPGWERRLDPRSDMARVLDAIRQAEEAGYGR